MTKLSNLTFSIGEFYGKRRRRARPRTPPPYRYTHSPPCGECVDPSTASWLQPQRFLRVPQVWQQHDRRHRQDGGDSPLNSRSSRSAARRSSWSATTSRLPRASSVRSAWAAAPSLHGASGTRSSVAQSTGCTTAAADEANASRCEPTRAGRSFLVYLELPGPAGPPCGTLACARGKSEKSLAT